MKFTKFNLLFLLTVSLCDLMGQSIATNILFEEAHCVFKGRVENIMQTYGDDDEQEFSIDVKAETYYKGVHYDYGALFKIITGRPQIVDTINKRIYFEEDFLVKEGADYIFFTKKPNPVSRSEEVLFAKLVDRSIEGFPYSVEFVNTLSRFEKASWLEPTYHETVAVRIMQQSSDLVVEAKVNTISEANGHEGYIVNIITVAGKSIDLQLHNLHCICAEGTISLNESYLFFLVHLPDRSNTLADRWMGIMQLNSLTKQYLHK